MIEIGSTWYVWGEHRTVLETRESSYGFYVRLSPLGKKPHWTDWVLARSVEAHGTPSQAYEVAA